MNETAAQDEIRRLNAELHDLRTGQITAILSALAEQGKSLAKLTTDVALVTARTEMLAPLSERLDSIERWKWTWIGAAGVIAAFIGWMFPKSGIK